MDRNLAPSNKNILDFIVKNNILDAKSLSHLIHLLEQDYFSNIIEIILQGEIADNELMIDIIHATYNIDILSGEEITILHYQDLNYSIAHGLFYFHNKNRQELIAVNNCLELTNLLRTKDVSQIKLVKKSNFYLYIEQNFSNLIIKAKYCLDFYHPTLTAKNIDFIKTITGFKLIFLATLFAFPLCFHLFNIGCYLTQILFKLLLFRQSFLPYQEDFSYDFTLPIYTILVPLYQEASMLSSIIQAVTSLNYPKQKLDIKIILEADDYQTIEALNTYQLPSYIQIVIVPFSLPRTKPKSLNYAMTYAKGEYVTIYDAEDRPEPDQLLKVISVFRQLPEEYACVQAKLCFYNADTNLLTKFFDMEYRVWFEYLLKGLSLLDLPVPLGGTSNHLKAKILHKLRYWDSYNVTEDAELGIRLYYNGYKTHIVDSYTFEESPITIANWLHQRSRWTKGFIQTFFTFFLHRKRDSKLTLLQTIAVYIFVGISTYSFYCFPWLICAMLANKLPLINYIWLISSIFVLLYSYGSVLYILYNLRRKPNTNKLQITDYIALVFWPFYFILHTIASYQAIFGIIKNPFVWNKTKRSNSNQDMH